jgi:hypothetical protein
MRTAHSSISTCAAADEIEGARRPVKTATFNVSGVDRRLDLLVGWLGA